MDGRRFDALTAAFARRTSRRNAVRGAGTGLAALLGGVAGLRGTTAQEATPDSAGSIPTLLFVQTATGGSFSPNPQVGTPAVDGTPTVGGGADYLLTLEGHHGGTIYFSDRPDRIFGDWPTQQFLDRLGFTPAFPPNAALVTEADADAEDEVIILELITPTWDEAAGTLTYGATILGGYAGEPLTAIVADQDAGLVPETFGRASLFIDDLPQEACFITLCAFPDGSVAFPIPGGPYDGYLRPYQNLNNTCYPRNLDEQTKLTAICSEDPRCPRDQGECTPL